MHISALSTSYVKDPHTVVKAGAVVKVKVMEVDLARKRIALSMRLSDEPGARAAKGPRDAAPPQPRNAHREHAPRDAAPAPESALAAAFARAKR